MKKIKKLLLCGAICALSLCCAVPVFASKNDKLLRAARDGNLHDVRYYVYEGANVNYKEVSTPLHLAAKGGYVAVVQFLLDNGANIEAKDRYGDTALIRAACEGHTKVVEILLDNGANIEAKDEYGWTALIRAAREGHTKVIEILLDNGANIEAKDRYGKTALVKAKNFNTIKCLLDRGAKINNRDNQGNSLLSGSLGLDDMCNLNVIKFLISRGLKINYSSDEAACLLGYAVDEDKLDTIKFLLDNGTSVNAEVFERRTALMEAASKCNINILKFLISRGAKIDAKDKYGNTALMKAAEVSNNWSIIEYLLKRGANINTKNNNGETALTCAISNSNFITAQHLITCGADINDLTKLPLDNSSIYADYNYLIFAIQNNKLDIVKNLINRGVDVNINIGDDKPSALMVAVSENREEIVKSLIAHGANVNFVCKDTQGYTALRRAILNGNADIIRLLLDYGASANEMPAGSNSAIELAISKNKEKSMQILFERGAKINLKDNKINTCFQNVIKNGDTNTLKAMLDHGAYNENREQINVILKNAIENNELNIVELFINSKFDINSRINYGDTALILASREGKIEIVKFLVNNGADVNIKTDYGNTALMVASCEGKTEIVKFLVDNGADVNVKNNDKRTALDLAKKYVKTKWVDNKEDYIEIIQLLESFQPKKKSIFSKLFSKDKKTNKPTTITKNEETIFQEPIFTPQPNVPAVPTFQNNNSSNINKNFNTLNNNSATKDLFDGIEDDSFFDVLKAIKNGANVNAVNSEDGMTPLMLAAVNGQLEIIKFLIQNHANVNEVFNNKTALKMAKNERIRQELINAGATI